MRRRRPRRGDDTAVAVTTVEELTAELRGFLRRGWERVDQELFAATAQGPLDWTSHAVVVEARVGPQVVGVASGEAIAGMARLHDLLVDEEQRGRGIGTDLVRSFCALAATRGAARCFLRCPATPRHRRFYERLGFVLVARIPRYYHGHDFLEYMREPLP
jgi:ribosomal protein S18 acetylase RimI-like enzyme